MGVFLARGVDLDNYVMVQNLAEMGITILAGERWTLKHRLLPAEYLSIWKREDDLRLSLVRNLTT